MSSQETSELTVPSELTSSGFFPNIPYPSDSLKRDLPQTLTATPAVKKQKVQTHIEEMNITWFKDQDKRDSVSKLSDLPFNGITKIVSVEKLSTKFGDTYILHSDKGKSYWSTGKLNQIINKDPDLLKKNFICIKKIRKENKDGNQIKYGTMPKN